MTDEPNKNTPVIRISIAGAVGDKAQISFETYADTASPIEFLNALTDKLMSVRDRQVAYYELKDLERLLEVEELQFKAIEGDLAREEERQVRMRAENKTRIDYKPLAKDVQARENIKINIQKRMEFIAKLKADINKRRLIVGEDRKI